MTPAAAALPVLRKLRNRYSEETLLQDAVSRALEAEGIYHWPEARLDKHSRIDFLLLEQCGIECKTSGSALSVMRQIYRYAEHLDEIVLVTARPLAIIGGIINDSNNRPTLLHVVELWRNPT